MGEGKGVACGKLPLPIGICPTCGHGVKVSRGFTWIDPAELFGDVKCINKADEHVSVATCNQHCHLSTVGVHNMHNAGLLWVGSKYYDSPTHFNIEEEDRIAAEKAAEADRLRLQEENKRLAQEAADTKKEVTQLKRQNTTLKKKVEEPAVSLNFYECPKCGHKW